MRRAGHSILVSTTVVVLALLLTGCAGPTGVVNQQPEQRPTAAASSQATPRPTASSRLGPAPTAPAAASLAPPTSTAASAAASLTSAPQPPPAARRYIFPVQPPSIAQYGPCHHDYPASDIFAPSGSRFVAVTAGVVDYVSTEDRWDPASDVGADRGGISVAIVGDDGVRYYGSHLSQLAEGIGPGQRVSAGQLLGLVGTTGSARHTPPHLHFGISRPTTPDDWEVRRGAINPVAYLNAWREGRPLKPDLDTVGGGVC